MLTLNNDNDNDNDNKALTTTTYTYIQDEPSARLAGTVIRPQDAQFGSQVLEVIA